MSWTVDEARRWLAGHVNHEALRNGPGRPRDASPSLERMRRLCALLGDPQDAQPAVHVTGTNGKGSAARMVTSLLAAHDLSVGTYTSPDLGDVRERITRNLTPIGDDDLAEVAQAVAAVESLLGEDPSYFEVVEAVAFRWFADLPVDAAVVEVGMGGRFDGTNVVDGQVAVVTNVALDHVEVIGPTRADIAREKAGIVKPGSTLVLGETDPELLGVFEAEGPEVLWWRDRDFGCEANLVGVGGRVVDLVTPGSRYDQVFVPLHGAHQGDNAAVALAAAEAFFGRPLEDDLIREGFASVTIPGRFEVVGRNPLVVLDGAHNPHGAAAAAEALEDFAVGGDRILVVGVMSSHDPVELLEALGARRARTVVATAADWPRALPAADVADAARGLGVDVEVVPRVADALARARSLASPDDAVLVAGSLYVVGEARRALRLG